MNLVMKFLAIVALCMVLVTSDGMAERTEAGEEGLLRIILKVLVDEKAQEEVS